MKLCSLIRPALVAGLGICVLAGCAPVPTKPDPADPWERVNRTTYKFNAALDRNVLLPVTRVYVKVTPAFARSGVSNFFNNLEQPTTILSNLFQAKPLPALRQLGRFVVNSTVGLGGLLDPATEMGLEPNPQDFGLLFGHWGAGPGPYVMLPLLGPSDLRDTFGRVPSIWTNPIHYLHDSTVSYGLLVPQVIDARAGLLGEQSIIDQSFDPYSFLKSAYLQRRRYLVTGENGTDVPADAGMEEELKADDAAEAASKAPPAPPAAPPRVSP
jgi:phospholipid-binding lipoprotein MlaA